MTIVIAYSSVAGGRLGNGNGTEPNSLELKRAFDDRIAPTSRGHYGTYDYEPLFLDCSYGFRPGRGPHDAVRDLQHYLYSHDVEGVIDIDIASYFDTIDQSRLLEMLSEKVADPRDGLEKTYRSASLERR